MSGYIEGTDRGQTTLFPEQLEDWIGEDNPVRVIDLFVDEIDLAEIGFGRTAPASTGRPGYRPSVLLKLFIYGYLNRAPSSRALEREAGRNVEVMWLTGRLAPDHKTIADFRRDNGPAIRKTCAQFVELCRIIGVLKGDCVAIDGSKFKAVNNRDKNFTKGKIASRIAHLEAGIARYLEEMVRTDRQEEGEARAEKIANLTRRTGRIRLGNLEHFAKGGHLITGDQPVRLGHLGPQGDHRNGKGHRPFWRAAQAVKHRRQPLARGERGQSLGDAGPDRHGRTLCAAARNVRVRSAVSASKSGQAIGPV